jgi:hypothetical protein
MKVSRDDLPVLILRDGNLPGRLIADFSGFGKRSPYFAGDKLH